VEHLTGFIDKSGAMVIAARYRNPDNFQEGRCLVRIPHGFSGTCAFIDEQGRLISEEYGGANGFYEGLAAVTDSLGGMGDKKENWGFIDRTGRVSIPKQFDDVSHFSEGLCRVSKGADKHGYIDKEGKFVFAVTAWSGDFHEGLASAVDSHGHYGFIDKRGHYVIPATFEEAGDFSAGLAPVQLGNKWGYVDDHGRMRINPKFQYACSFNTTMAEVQMTDGKWGAIDHQGVMRVEPKYDVLLPFSEGRGSFCIDSKWGVLDEQGAVIVKPQYEYIEPFHEGLAAASKLSPFFEGSIPKGGFIDRQGNVVIPFKFRSASRFASGLSAVTPFDPNELFPPKQQTSDWPASAQWVGQKLGDPQQSIEFKSDADAIIKHGTLSYTVKYSIEAINSDDPGLDGYNFVFFHPQAKLRIHFQDQQRERTSLWAIEFLKGTPWVAYRLYRNAESDPWGDSFGHVQ
jgi:hypothetical protein